MEKVSHARIVKLALERALTYAATDATRGAPREQQLAFEHAETVLDRLATDPALLVSDVKIVEHTATGRTSDVPIGPAVDAAVGFRVTGRVAGIRYATFQESAGALELPLTVVTDPSEYAAIADRGQQGRPARIYWNAVGGDSGADGTVNVWPRPSAGAVLRLYVFETALRKLTAGGESWLGDGEMALLVSEIACSLCAPLGIEDVPASLRRERNAAVRAVRRNLASKIATSGGIFDPFAIDQTDLDFRWW